MRSTHMSRVLCKALRSLSAAGSIPLTCVLGVPLLAPAAEAVPADKMSAILPPTLLVSRPPEPLLSQQHLPSGCPREALADTDTADKNSEVRVGVDVVKVVSPHVSFKNSPIMLQGLEHNFLDSTASDVGGENKGAQAVDSEGPGAAVGHADVRATATEKKKISDMKPAPMKPPNRRKERARQRADAANVKELGPADCVARKGVSQRPQYALKKSYEVRMVAETGGACVAFKKLVYTNRHAVPLTFSLARIDGCEGVVAVEFQTMQLVLDSYESGTVAIKLIRKAQKIGQECTTEGSGDVCPMMKIKVAVTPEGPSIGGGAGNAVMTDLIEILVVLRD